MTRPKPVTAVRALKVRPERRLELPEQVATEEPLELRAAGPREEPLPVAVTMRTPGHDFELAAGFFVTEGLASPAEIAAVGYCQSVSAGEDHYRDESRYNTVTVALTRPWVAAPARAFPSSASCGVCGKATIDQVRLSLAPVGPAEALPASLLPELPDRLRSAQRIFGQTGGLHAAGLFDAGGTAACVREDIGRHNAVDKVAGHMVLGGGGADRRLPDLAGHALMVSGRVSFEIVQKAAACGIGTIAAVSAPSSLAVRAADRLGLALLGFMRDRTYNVYSHPERLDFSR
jgi:FdhD protein